VAQVACEGSQCSTENDVGVGFLQQQTINHKSPGPWNEPSEKAAALVEYLQKGNLDSVLTPEEIEVETLLLQRLLESPQNETELEMLLKTLADIERAPSGPALVSSDAASGTVNIFVDGFTPVSVPREVTKGFSQEIFYSFPIERSAVNGTHVFLDSSKRLRGEFVKETHVRNSYEYGKVEQSWFAGPLSLSTFPNAVFGSMEKLLTLSHDGAWPTSSLDRARAEQAQRWGHTNWLARKMRPQKTLAWFLYHLKSKVAQTWLNAALDPNHLTKVVELAQKNGGQPESSLAQREHVLLRKLADSSSKSTNAKLTSASNGCLHLTENPGIQVSSSGAFIPLGRKLVTYKGDMVSSPLQQFNILGGVATFTYDPRKGVLNIFVGVSSFLFLPDPQELVQPKFFVGPADGASFPVAEEGRVQTARPSRSMYAMYHAAHRIPMDYDYLFADPKQLCPPHKFNRLAEEANQMDLMVYMREPQPSLADQVRLMNHMVDMIDCGTTFFRAVHQHGNGVGLFEVAVWSHFLMEVPVKYRLQFLSDWSIE